MASEHTVMLDETLYGYRSAEDVVSGEATMCRSKNKPCESCMASSAKCDCRSYQKTRRSLRIANKSRNCNSNGVSGRKRKIEGGAVKRVSNPYVEQIEIAIEELNSRIGKQKRLRAGYEKSFQYVKEILKSYCSLCKTASEEVNNCRAGIERIKEAIKQQTGSVFAEKLVGEICAVWQSGTEDKETLNELFNREKNSISQCFKKARTEYEAYQKILEDNMKIEQTCKRKRDEKATDLEKIEGQIIGVNAAIAELQSALIIQKKYKRKLRILGVSRKTKKGGCSLHPRPVCHPIWPKRDGNDDIIVINVSPCPVCTLGFEAETLDIIVASCGHTFHPFCLVSDGKVLRKCPKCDYHMPEMWLKSFGVVEAGTFHSQIKNSEKINASSQYAEIQSPTVAESRMESSAKSDTGSTLAQKIADIKSTLTGYK